MWNSAKVSWPFFPASRNPILRSAFKVDDMMPARTSISVTAAAELSSVSKIFIWSGTEVTSTTSVMSGWNRLRVPRGHSVSKARVGILRAAR